MEYNSTMTITRASAAGSTDPITGIFTPSGDAVIVYDGRVDAQEVSGLMVGGGNPATDRGDLAVFLKDESGLTAFRIGDTGTLTRKGRTQQVVVRKIRLLDGMVEVDVDE